MKNDEFKIKKSKDQTVYTLESASSGGTSSGSVASIAMPVGTVRKQGDNLITQEGNKDKVDASKPRNFVAKNAKMGGAGQHKDKKKAQKQGTEKHKKPFAESIAELKDKFNALKEAGFGSNKGYTRGFASPTAPSLGGRGREDDEYHNGGDDEFTYMMYKYNTQDGKLKQRKFAGYDYDGAKEDGWRANKLEALKLQGIIRSKFDPKQWVQNQGGKWIKVFPFGQHDVAEAADSNFVGFMNKAMGNRQDKAPVKYDAATTMSMSNMPGYKYAFKFGMDIIKKMDPDTKQHFAEENDDALFSYILDIGRKKKLVPGKFVEEDLDEVTGEFEEIFHDPEMEGWSWADLLRDMIGAPVRAHRKANVQAHKAQMAKAQEKMNAPIDPKNLEVVDRTDTGKSEIWYPQPGPWGDSWFVVANNFNNKQQAEQKLQQLQRDPNAIKIIQAAINKDQDVAEASMPSSVIKNKQRNAAMSDKDFHAAHKDKSEDDLKAMAHRHGYGKGSTHYVDKHKKGQQGVAEGSLNEFAPDGFNDGEDQFDPGTAQDAYDDGVRKGVSLSDNVDLARAMAINYWHMRNNGLYKQYFAKGFKVGREDKIQWANTNYGTNLKLMKDGSIRRSDQGVAEGSNDADRIQALWDRYERAEELYGKNDPRTRALADQIRGAKDEFQVIGKQGFTQGVAEGFDDGEPEGDTLKNSLHTIIRVATHLDKALDTNDDFPEWVSEKIGATKGMMVSVMDYLISDQEMDHDSDAMGDGPQIFAEDDAYMVELATKLEEKISKNAPVKTYIDDFSKAAKTPNAKGHHQFKNKSPEKVRQMAIAASYGAKNPSKKK